jgi:dipeptidyl aminopeptidase/acylaminoacyl peptidase
MARRGTAVVRARGRGKLRSVASLGLVAGFVLAIGVGDVRAAFPGGNGRVAFAVQKWRLPDVCPPIPHGCEPELYSSSIETVLPSGRGRRVLRAFPPEQSVGQSGAVWSPSGRLLTFQQRGSRLAIIRADGTQLRLLPQLTSGDDEPTWSPDGRRLAFVGRVLCCRWLYTVRRDGTARRRVTGQEVRWPAWSTTGQIAFVNYNDQRAGVVGIKDGTYTIRPDGSRLRLLFDRYWGTGQQPDWSPDGSRIAFVARQHIFTMSADGRRLRRLTDNFGDSDPAWSPNGKYIAFIRDHDLYVMRANGRGERRVVDGPDQGLDHPSPWAEVSAPSWQPLPR